MYYVDIPPSGLFLQGDIFRDLFIATSSEAPLVVRSSDKANDVAEGIAILTQLNNTRELFASGFENIVLKAIKTNIIIISQTCDILNREFVIIAPVFPLSRIESAKKARSLKEGKMNYRFYLPRKEGIIEESYAELTILNSIKRTALLPEKRILSLTDFYRSHFTYHSNISASTFYT